ncbi:hypothetical protein B0T14DRAFT_426729, partial [Immersiella caudata]
MSDIVLVPYNESMRLGQGFNSFLQVPCILDAVEISETPRASGRPADPKGVSQSVSYSSRFVDKISDVVRNLNISPAASVKSGTIELSGNSSGVDEAKFSASDINAVVSVKVINESTTTTKDANRQPDPKVKTAGQSFFSVYGDCYISGFLSGGEFHGIVSIKVLDVRRKAEVESKLKGKFNAPSGKGFTLSENLGSSGLDATLRETETTITVNWTGGGEIKPDGQEWTLDTLMKAAASFPNRVAACPQRTWAILTKYTKNRSFLEWEVDSASQIPNFSLARAPAEELLDSYMAYKSSLTRLNDIMANPGAYKLSPFRDPISIDVESLVQQRKFVRSIMKEIVAIVDLLNDEPSKIPQERIDKVPSSEIWATRLPILKQDA